MVDHFPREIERILNRFEVFRGVVIDSAHLVSRLALHVDTLQNRGIVSQRVHTSDVEEELLFTFDTADAPFGEEL